MKISIIIPMYNAEHTIEKCVNNILHQSYQDIEVILIDDCSNDHTWIIATQLTDNDSRISLYHNEKNLGAGESRNIGIEHSTGSWITFCDADDYPDKDWISDFVSGITIDAEMVIQGFICDNWPERTTGRIVAFNGIGNRDIVIDALCKHHVFGYLWCKMYRASIIKKHAIRFKDIVIEEDELFNLQYLKHVHQIVCLPQCNYHYNYPDFYTKYGHIDNFQENIEMFLTACDSFGPKPMRIKDMYTALTSDWLLSAYRSNKSNKHERLAVYCKTIGPYLPYAYNCRNTIRLLRFFISPGNTTLSHIGMTIYANTIGLFRK